MALATAWHGRLAAADAHRAPSLSVSMNAPSGTPPRTSSHGVVQKRLTSGREPFCMASAMYSWYELLPGLGRAAGWSMSQLSGMLSGWPSPRKWPISCSAAASKS